jgi:hypothetical protein
VSARYWQIQGGNELPQWLLTNLLPLPVPSKKTSNGAFSVTWLFCRRRAPYHHRPGRRQLGRGQPVSVRVTAGSEGGSQVIRAAWESTFTSASSPYRSTVIVVDVS